MFQIRPINPGREIGFAVVMPGDRRRLHFPGPADPVGPQQGKFLGKPGPFARCAFQSDALEIFPDRFKRKKRFFDIVKIPYGDDLT